MSGRDSQMLSAWSLTSVTNDGPLSLGKTPQEVSAAFGEPTDIAHHIWKYDSIELHFADEQLWLIHCEFGEAPLPASVESERLRILPDGLEWPLDEPSLVAMIQSRGFDFEAVPQTWGVEYRFGLASISIHDGDALVILSISSLG